MEVAVGAHADDDCATTSVRARLAHRRRALGPDHPSTWSLANNEAPLLRRQGRYDQARRLDEAMLRRRHELLGADHARTLSSANNLVVDLAAVGAHVRARRLAEDTLARRRRELGDSRWVPQRCRTVDQRLRHPGFRGHANSPISILWTPTRLSDARTRAEPARAARPFRRSQKTPRSSYRATRSRCCAEQPAPENDPGRPRVPQRYTRGTRSRAQPFRDTQRLGQFRGEQRPGSVTAGVHRSILRGVGLGGP